MNLKLMVPSQVLIDCNVAKVGAEAPYGTFVVLPRHIDFATSLMPGLLSFQADDGGEEFLAVDEGVFVKCGDQVLVSTGNAVYGPDLERLKETVQAEFRNLDQQERKARTALAKLEADFIRRYLEIGE